MLKICNFKTTRIDRFSPTINSHLCCIFEGDLGANDIAVGIAVLNFFSSGISVILILKCGIAGYHLALRYAVFYPLRKRYSDGIKTLD